MVRGIVAGIVLVALAVTEAAAFTVEGRGDPPVVLRWPTSTIAMRLGPTELGGDQPTSASIDAAIRAAFASWQEPDCTSVRFVEGPRVEGAVDWEHPDDPSIQVFFVTDPVVAENAFYLAGTGPSIGKYWFAFDADDQALLAATVYLNGVDIAWSTADVCEDGRYDVQSIVANLIARTLGLASTDPLGSAVRGGAWPADHTRRTLEPDDEAGIAYLYPAGPECGLTPPDEICIGTADRVCPPFLADPGPPADCTDEPPDPGPIPPLQDAGAPSPDAAVAPPADAGAPDPADAGTPPRFVTYGCCSSAPGAPSDNAAAGLLAALLVLVRAGRRRTRLSTRLGALRAPR